jgi:hypothetical protein
MTTFTQPGKPAPSGLSGRLFRGRDGAAHISRRLATRDWWLFATCDPAGTAFLDHLEHTYYAGEAGRDFELLLMPALAEGFGVVGLFLARKNRLPADQLAREINSRVGGPITAAELRRRDVLFPHEDTRIAAALAEWLVGFLRPSVRPEDN